MSTTEKTYSIEGMSCAHCEAAIAERVGAVEGVSQVGVDSQSGRITVQGEGFSDEGVHGAVVDAGYKVAPNQGPASQ